METLRIKPCEPMPKVESWDDDIDLAVGVDELSFGNTSTAAPSRRDSHSSHLSTSARSELESLQGEETQLQLPTNDEKSTLDAVAVARNAGIPIPQNVPPSALTGGTIRRLGGRKTQKAMAEDWTEDLILPEQGQLLHIKRRDASKFPAVLRQVSDGSSTCRPAKPPSKKSQSQVAEALKATPARGGPINLDDFKDDDDFFGDGMETIKVSRRQAKPLSLITPPTPQKGDAADDDFETDLELPPDGKLQLSKSRDIPKTPAISTAASDDFDWGEGSLGTRFGGTRRSARSSSASALSPSVSSSITAESEDDSFEGLLLPNGPLDLRDRLQRRRISRSPERILEEPAEPRKQSLKKVEKDTSKSQEDILEGLDIGDGEVFDSKKLTLNRNIKVKNARPHSPTRPKTTMSLTFTNKPCPAPSRLPRPSHERARSSLEPVSESGDPIQCRNNRRSLSRLGGHSAQSSISSIATPTTPSSATSIPTTAGRRQLAQKPSQALLRNPEPPHTTSAQLLRLKRSCPIMKATQPPSKPLTSRYDRPPSRTENSSRQPHIRPKTPVERRPKTPTEKRTAEGAAARARKNTVPFLPAGASVSASQHISAKSSRAFRRHDSDNSLEFRPNSRAVSRLTIRSPSPRRHRMFPDTWRHQTKPTRQRHFGDGHELDGFDDLPTSKEMEAKFMHQPVMSGPKTTFRSKNFQNILPDRTAIPSPLTPYAPGRVDNVPHFARDTAASRIARETSLAQRAAPSGPGVPLTAQSVAQLSARTNFTPQLPGNTVRSRKSRKPVQSKPLLISNLNSNKQSKRMLFFPPLPRIFVVLTVLHSYKWHALQPGDFSLGRKRECPGCIRASCLLSINDIPTHAARKGECHAALGSYHEHQRDQGRSSGGSDGVRSSEYVLAQDGNAKKFGKVRDRHNGWFQRL